MSCCIGGAYLYGDDAVECAGFELVVNDISGDYGEIGQITTGRLGIDMLFLSSGIRKCDHRGRW